jgi:23S rRNA (adenine-N6)-dimethyltransferase
VSRASARDGRRRALGQNFLRDEGLATELSSLTSPGELVVEFGAGDGALTIPLAAAGARVLAIERDPQWAEKVKRRLVARGLAGRVDLMAADMLAVALPGEPYRVVASPPFNLTTALLRTLLENPTAGPYRADLIVQWEVARKRSAVPPTTLLSTMWAPWWQFEIVRRISRGSFRPVPKVDAAWLAITKRQSPLLPSSLAPAWAAFVQSHWREIGG